MGFSFEVDDEQKIARWSLNGAVADTSFRESLRVVSEILGRAGPERRHH
jgi:hypothetical protein